MPLPHRAERVRASKKIAEALVPRVLELNLAGTDIRIPGLGASSRLPVIPRRV